MSGALRRVVQRQAKRALSKLAETIDSQSTERSIVEAAVRLLRAEGLTQTWYYDCPALVLLGTRSRLSASGRTYQPADEPVGECNLVTVDVSPRVGDVWGDAARSYCVERGRCVERPERPEFRDGLATLDRLHAEVREFVTERTTFEQLFEFANRRIRDAGYVNLDFMGNVGHDLPTRRDRRSYVEAGNRRRLADTDGFTFEPHVARPDGRWGFKREEIYVVRGGICRAADGDGGSGGEGVVSCEGGGMNGEWCGGWPGDE